MIIAKKIPVIIVLFTTAIPLVFFIFFIAHQNVIRWQMEEKLEEEQLTSITIHANDFKWYEEGKEIIINDHLFDVKSIAQLPGDSLLITGLYDHQEQKLHKDLDNWMKNKGTSSKENFQSFAKWLSYLYDDNISTQSEYSFKLIAIDRHLYYTRFLGSVALNVLTPPPQLMFF